MTLVSTGRTTNTVSGPETEYLKVGVTLHKPVNNTCLNTHVGVDLLYKVFSSQTQRDTVTLV